MGFCVASTKNGSSRRAVDLVGQNDVGKNRTLQELELARARRAVFLNHFRAGDVGGHQVGSELDAAELQRQGVGQRANHQRLGQARHAHQQAMAAREHRDQELLDNLPLAHDHFAQLGRDLPERFVQLVHGLHVVVMEHRKFSQVRETFASYVTAVVRSLAHHNGFVARPSV
jgi:hypothetical protein